LRDGRNALEASAGPATPGATFPLTGSFEITNADGDGIVGTYDGAAQFSGDALQTSSLTLQVSGGSGALAGATGAIVAKGEGAFADEGKFVLDGRGELTLAGGKRANIVLNLRGSSFATCSTSGLVAISQTGVGNLGRAGHVDARFSHQVANTSCDS
jgi:hypothetical protein